MRNLYIITSLAIIVAMGCTCSPKNKVEQPSEKSVAVTGVSLTRSQMDLDAGDQFKLVARVTPANATNSSVRWSSDKPEIVSVDAESGDARALSEGSASVTATTADGGFTASCTVSVGAGDSYAVTVVNGKADRAKASEGETVTIKAQASDEGQVFYRWTSSDGVTFADARSSETTFTMPDHPVTVTATYKAKSGGSSGSGSGGGQKDTGTYKITVEEAKNGTVTASKKTADKGDKVKLTVTPDEGWVLETLTVTTAKGKEVELTAGSGDTWSFKMPGANVTVRAAFERLNPYVDVEKGAYYYDAVLWAHYAQPQITNGMDATHFGPDTTTTRAHIVTFLWRANGCQEPAGVENPFEDVAESDYFYKAVLWAVEQGIVKGTDETHFTPAQTCSTAHIVTMLYRALGAGEDGWFEEAGAWAVAQGLLEDMELTVGTDVDCPRGAIVTFLYRALTEN